MARKKTDQGQEAIGFQRRYDCATCKATDCRGAWPPGASTGYKALFCIVQSDDEYNSSREEKLSTGIKYRSATGEPWDMPIWLDKP